MNRSGERQPRDWIVRHADLIYRVLIVALAGLWLVFPPSRSEAPRPPAGDVTMPAVEARRG